jgi:hypothetical protein
VPTEAMRRNARMASVLVPSRSKGDPSYPESSIRLEKGMAPRRGYGTGMRAPEAHSSCHALQSGYQVSPSKGLAKE